MRNQALKWAVFVGGVVVGAAALHPSEAMAYWTMYPGSLCEPTSNYPDISPQVPRLAKWMSVLTNNIVSSGYGAAYPDEVWGKVVCPILDDSLHGKGGSTVHLNVMQYPSKNWGTQWSACAAFDGGVLGASCGPTIFSGSTDGLQDLTSTPPSSVWQTGNNYAYLMVDLGSMTSRSTTPNTIQGYWVVK